MKINKSISVLLASMLIGGMLVGCSNNSNSDTTKALTKSVKEVEKDNKETKDKKEKKTPSQDNKENSSKNIPKSVKQKSKAKETTTVEPFKCKYCNDTIYYIIEDKEYGINGDICWNCYWNKLMDIIFGSIEDNEEEEESVEEPVNNDDYDTDICSICGGHVGVKEMCECDGTIHHRTCHINNDYTCPNCNRNGLTEDPDVYGCPYCGYPNEVEDYEEPIQEADDVEEYEEEKDYNEEHQESSNVEEYNDEVDTIDDIDEDINY